MIQWHFPFEISFESCFLNNQISLCQKLNWYSRFSFRVLFIPFNFCDFKILDAFLSFLFSRNLKRWFDFFVPLVYKYTFTYFVAMLLFVSTFRFPGVVVQGKRNTVKQKGTLAHTELSRYIFICDRNKKKQNKVASFSILILPKSVKKQIKSWFIWEELISIWK